MTFQPAIITQRLLFVGGFPSGGTDLTKTILNSHPDVNIGGETPFLYRLPEAGFNENFIISNADTLSTLKKFLSHNDIYNVFQNSSSSFEELTGSSDDALTIEQALFRLLTVDHALIHGSKTPQLTEQLELFYTVLPNALFLIVVRDVRDVCLSWEKKWGKDKILCAAKWATRMEKGLSYAKKVGGKRVLFIRYEDLLANTRETLERVCNFAGVRFSSSMLEHHKHTKEKIDGKINYGKKLNPKNFDKWTSQLSAKTVRRIEEIAGETLRTFGYELANEPLRISEITRHERIIGKMRDLYALLFIGNRKLSRKKNLQMRAKSIFIEIKKRI